MTCYDANNPARKWIDDVSSSVRCSEIFGVVGLVGAGCTELMQTVFGVYEGASEVELVLDGGPLKIHVLLDVIHAGIAMVPEDRKYHGIISPMSVGHDITLAILQRFARLEHIDGAAGLDTVCKEMRRPTVRVVHPTLPIASLSGGNRQKAVLTRMLLMEPRVLILDEPIRGMDTGAKYGIYKLIGDLAKRGMAIIVISSESPEVLGILDRVLVIGEGQPRGNFVNDGLTQEYILTAAIQPAQGPPRHAVTFHQISHA